MQGRHSLFLFIICIGWSLTAIAATPDAKPDLKTAKDSDKNQERYENLSLLQKVLYFVEQNYVEEVKNKELIYGAIKGMLETLDPHSNFLPPETFREMKIDTSGKFGGVGIEIGIKGSILTVISPIEDTPAFKAGIRPGDKIIKINGESTKGLNLVEAVSKMRGKKGSDLVLTVWRDGFTTAKDFKIKRAEIKIASTKSETLEPHYLYTRLTNFNENAANDLDNAISKFEKKNKSIKGLILDLRNNPGGLLDQAVDITSLFLDEGIVVSTQGRTDDTKEIKYAKKGKARKDFPMVVLVNGASASASEIVAGALQDHHRAVIMGQPTFGKGSVQTVIELQPDIGLKLTIARYYTPSGKSIQLKGIQPDVVLEDLDQKVLAAAIKKSSMIRERDLKHHMEEEDDEGKEFIPEEYMASKTLDTVDTSKQDDAQKDKLKDKKDDELKVFVAKEDYQVKEALKYIKSYQYFRAAEDSPIKTSAKAMHSVEVSAKAQE